MRTIDGQDDPGACRNRAANNIVFLCVLRSDRNFQVVFKAPENCHRIYSCNKGSVEVSVQAVVKLAIHQLTVSVQDDRVQMVLCFIYPPVVFHYCRTFIRPARGRLDMFRAREGRPVRNALTCR